jgi:hypothetical protein
MGLLYFYRGYVVLITALGPQWGHSTDMARGIFCVRFILRGSNGHIATELALKILSASQPPGITFGSLRTHWFVSSLHWGYLWSLLIIRNNFVLKILILLNCTWAAYDHAGAARLTWLVI